MMVSNLEQITEATKFIRGRYAKQPTVGIVLGSGLGSFANELTDRIEIPFQEIPHFPKATVIGHSGKLVAGKIGKHEVVALQGRFHLYEGHSAELAALPIRIFKQLGIELLILSNAAGGLNPNFKAGQIMVIDDQINLQFRNPLIGINDDQLGPRFPDMWQPFDGQLIRLLQRHARRLNVAIQQGVYAAVLGPNYETRAEIRMLRKLGADAVGMSTVPEVLAAVHANIRVLGLSVITNECQPDIRHQTSGEEVVETASSVETDLRDLITAMIDSL